MRTGIIAGLCLVAWFVFVMFLITYMYTTHNNPKSMDDYIIRHAPEMHDDDMLIQRKWGKPSNWI